MEPVVTDDSSHNKLQHYHMKDFLANFACLPCEKPTRAFTNGLICPVYETAASDQSPYLVFIRTVGSGTGPPVAAASATRLLHLYNEHLDALLTRHLRDRLILQLFLADLEETKENTGSSKLQQN